MESFFKVVGWFFGSFLPARVFTISFLSKIPILDFSGVGEKGGFVKTPSLSYSLVLPLYHIFLADHGDYFFIGADFNFVWEKRKKQIF